MQKFMDYMTDVVAPKLNKLTRNPYIAAVQDSILATMPLIFIGTIGTILDTIREAFPSFPECSGFASFSFSLLSLFLSFLIPAYIMEKKDQRRTRNQAALAGVALFIMVLCPTIADGNFTVIWRTFGSGGMIVAIVTGIFVGFVMSSFGKMRLFGDDSAIPDFVTVWFDTLIPILLCMFVGWVLTSVLHVDLISTINSIFLPLLAFGETFWGFVLINFLAMTFLYSFGISTWCLYGVTSVLALTGIEANMAAAAAGQAATHLNIYEVTWIMTIGGTGATLSLCLMMAFLAKSKRLRLMGRTCLAPSMFNINEPLVYGTPICFNAMLMVPMWAQGIINAIITWFAFKGGLVPVPTKVFQLWYLPKPIYAFFSTGSIAGAILCLVLFAVSWVIYYPFFKAYDKQCVEEEAADAE
ncbi:MAG: PTS sugar transporter subunit IIC [Erysipelotrichaceae bacterium]|nr:PTS sugar transporter subunit IIC [Erysipelotrichaceae bacterium]